MISHLVEPFDNFFILPNNFFVFILDFLGKRKNSSSILKVLLYLLKHAWRKTTGNKHIRFSFRICEIQNGIKRGKRRVDHGTGLSPNSIRKALKTLIKKGVVKEITISTHKEYYLVIHETDNESEETEDFSNGWPAPKTNFFKVPNSFTDAIVNIDSPTSILTMLYEFRHSWGFQNKDGVFMSADEISNGRKRTDGSRYDSGIGIHVSSIYREIGHLVELGWITWTDRGFASPETLYNLHLEHHSVDPKSGEFLGRLPWENDQDYEFFLSENQDKFNSTSQDEETDNELKEENEKIPPQADQPIRSFEQSSCNVEHASRNVEQSSCNNSDNPDPNHEQMSCNVDHPIPNNEEGICNVDFRLNVINLIKLILKDTTKTHFNQQNKQNVGDVIVRNNLFKFLKNLGVKNPSLQRIINQGHENAFVVSWLIYTVRQKNLTQPLGFWITKINVPKSKREIPPGGLLNFCKTPISILKTDEIEELFADSAPNSISSDESPDFEKERAHEITASWTKKHTPDLEEQNSIRELQKLKQQFHDEMATVTTWPEIIRPNDNEESAIPKHIFTTWIKSTKLYQRKDRPNIFQLICQNQAVTIELEKIREHITKTLQNQFDIAELLIVSNPQIID